MITFKDAHSVRGFTDAGEPFETASPRTWYLSIDYPLAKEIEQDLGVDIINLFTGKTAGELLSNPGKLIDVLFMVCREQCEQRGVSDIEFGRSIKGQSILDASVALLESVAAFFPPKDASLFRLQIVKSQMVSEEIQARVYKALKEVSLPQLIGAEDLPGTSESQSTDNTGGESPSVT